MKIPKENLGTVWGRDAEKPVFNSLAGDLEADVAIVGGGITGISAAYTLSKAGMKVFVLEASEVGKGTTGSPLETFMRQLTRGCIPWMKSMEAKLQRKL
jgi:heterodisulfide reductase subunit A-like polyferredoxin